MRRAGTFLAILFAAAAPSAPAFAADWAIAIHGGAGKVVRGMFTAEEEEARRVGLAKALTAGGAVLDQGGSAVDAVEAAVRVLEDDPHFNAGRGAVLTEAGTVELDAAIMDGASRRAGSVAGVTTTRNPVSLARAIMERGKQVMFVGPGADAQGRQFGLEQVEPSYFITDEERNWLRNHRAKSGASRDDRQKYGTVGAVARDRAGHLAAATSTGGLMAKPPGRVGDSPIIGAGTYAQDGGCAVSATGAGEFYIRVGTAHSICSRMILLKADPKAAADAVQAETLAMGGKGGVIVLAPDGAPVWSFNTEGMYRGALQAGGKAKVALYGDE